MPRKYYEIHTEEKVHGVYVTLASSYEDAKAKFNRGDLVHPLLYETVDAEVMQCKERDIDDQ